MPVLKCSNGKYRIGSGKCMYRNRESAERAYRGYLGATYGESAIARAIQSVDQYHTTKRTQAKKK